MSCLSYDWDVQILTKYHENGPTLTPLSTEFVLKEHDQSELGKTVRPVNYAEDVKLSVGVHLKTW